MNITIRNARPADVPDIVEMLTKGLEGNKDLSEKYIRDVQAQYPESFKNIITDENTTHYIVQQDNKTVGLACITPPQDEDISDDYYQFHNLVFHPDYDNDDIYKIAINLIFDTIRSLGKTATFVWVWEKNIKGIKRYEECGFTADGKTKVFEMFENSFNGIRMKRDL